MEVVIKSPASAASRKTRSRGPRSMEGSARQRLGKRTAAGWDAPLDLRLDLVFLEAALAADLITASISLHVPNPGNHFLEKTIVYSS